MWSGLANQVYIYGVRSTPLKPVSLRIGQSPGNSDEKEIPPEAVIWVTLMSVPPAPEGAVLCGSLWPGKGGIFESIMRSPVRQTHCVEAAEF